jgi:hypothetical protein
MRQQYIESAIHQRHGDITPGEMLTSILEQEGDVLGWEQEALIRETSMKLDEPPEVCFRMVRFALNGLIRGHIVLRDDGLITLSELRC